MRHFLKMKIKCQVVEDNFTAASVSCPGPGGHIFRSKFKVQLSKRENVCACVQLFTLIQSSINTKYVEQK